MYNESITELNQKLKKMKKQYEIKLKELKIMEADIEFIEDLIELKKKRKDFTVKMNGLHMREIPIAYGKNLFQEQKAIYAIWALGGEASVKTITEYICNAEPASGFDPQAVYKRVQQIVIKLTKEYKLIKIGKYASTYKLNMID